MVSAPGVMLVLLIASPSAALQHVAIAVPASTPVLYVAAAAPTCDDARTRDQATSPDTPWCTLERAVAAVLPGDTVQVAAARYPALRLDASGTPGASIRFLADAGATLDAAATDTALRLIGTHDVQVDGFTVTGAARQGVWLDGAASVMLSHLDVSANAGTGIQLKNTTGVTVQGSRVAGNARAGISELAGSRGTQLVGDVVTGNGHDGQLYGGDGIELDGQASLVTGTTVTGNGDSPLYEHGIYVGVHARGYELRGNDVSGSSGADIKAAGAGSIVGNRLGDARLGLVLNDNPTTVNVSGNSITGTFQHAVFLTSGTTPARAALRDNTIRQTGAAASGDASAIFVNAAAALILRGNAICYAAADRRGADLAVPAPTRLGALSADGNRYCTVRGGLTPFALGTSRLDLPGWQAATGQDRNSVIVPT